MTARRRAEGPSRSTLFSATTRGLSAAPRSLKTCSTVSACSSADGELASSTWMMTSASVTTSSVALKAATRSVGSFWMKPTVSVRSRSRPAGSPSLRVVGSSVAKSFCSARSPSPSADLAIVSVGADQPRQQVMQPSCLHLQATFMGSRVLGEDLEDDLGAVEHPGLDIKLQVALLPRAQILVADDEVELAFELQVPQRLDLAHADEMRGVHFGPPLHLRADNFRARRPGQVRQLGHLVPDRLGAGAREQD